MLIFTVQWYLSVLIMYFKNKIWKDKLVFSKGPLIKNYLKRHKRNNIHSLFNALYQWLHQLILAIDLPSEPLHQPELRKQNKQREGKELGLSWVHRSLCLSGPSVPYALWFHDTFSLSTNALCSFPPSEQEIKQTTFSSNMCSLEVAFHLSLFFDYSTSGKNSLYFFNVSIFILYFSPMSSKNHFLENI